MIHIAGLLNVIGVMWRFGRYWTSPIQPPNATLQQRTVSVVQAAISPVDFISLSTNFRYCFYRKQSGPQYFEEPPALHSPSL